MSINWIPVKERLPSKADFGPYPTVDVILQCRANRWQRREGHAVLRYFGGDPNRPFWCTEKDSRPIENDSWWVTHWAPIPDFPHPIEDAVWEPQS